MTTAVQNNGAGGFAATSTTSAAKADETAERFLTLLVAQIRNQDPLNPLDNHQVTTQMAQINTVNGIEKLNRTVGALGTQFASLQLMQGAALVGREVTVPGDRLSFDAEGRGHGGFELAGPADRVKVELLNGAGVVVDTLQLGAQSSGRHDFDYTPRAGVGTDLRMRVVATSGAAAVTAAPLMRDRVEAVAADGDTLTLELARSGKLAWADVRAFN